MLAKLSHLVRRITAALMVAFGTLTLLGTWRLRTMDGPKWFFWLGMAVGAALLTVGFADWLRLNRPETPRKANRPGGSPPEA